jgi:hypothetical protein
MARKVLLEISSKRPVAAARQIPRGAGFRAIFAGSDGV